MTPARKAPLSATRITLLVKVWYKQVGKPVELCCIEDSSKVLEQLIGGHFSGYHLCSYNSLFNNLPLMVLCHDTGKLIGLPYNFSIGLEPIVGNAVIVRYDCRGETVDLTAADIELLNFL